MTQLQAAELIENLPEILKGLRQGEQYVLCQGDTPIATLMPYVEHGIKTGPPSNIGRSMDEEESDDDDFARDLEEGIEENADLLRRLAQ